MSTPEGLVQPRLVGVILRPFMRSLPLAQPRGRPGRCGIRLVASFAGLALLLPSGPVQAAAPAPQACPTDAYAAPPELALLLKNAGQELRAAGSFLRASQCFRNAVEELPDCATYADERLRWGLWAAEDLERAEPGKDTSMRAFLDQQVALLEATPEGRSLPDYPLLVAARDRQGRPGHGEGAYVLAASAPRRTQRVALGLWAGGAPLVLAGAVLTGLFGAKGHRLDDRLGANNRDGNAEDCTAAAQPGESGRCADLRSVHAELHAERLVASRGLITGVTVLGVGAGLLIAGLVTKLYGRRPAHRRAALRVLPTGAGLMLRGQF